MNDQLDLGIPGISDPVEIGRGGFGVVYRARQPAVDRDVAVKVLSMVTPDESARRRFEREIRAMGRLSDHPHIVTVFDAGTTAGGAPYLTMAYLPGGSLADRLEDRGPLPWQEVAEVGVRVASALEAAHRIGIVHRDVKPSNVLVSAFGSPQLADFGIARLAGDASVTATGVTSGTPAFLPPEVIGGGEPGPAGDVYSLGATLYALLNGSPAFVESTDASVLAVMARVAADPPPDLRPGVPEPLWRCIEKSMAKDPADRYQSAAGFAEAIAGAQRELGVTPTPLVIGVEDEAAPTGKTTIITPPPEDIAPPPQPPPRPWWQRPAWIGGGVAAVIVAVILLVLALSGGEDVVAGSTTTTVAATTTQATTTITSATTTTVTTAPPTVGVLPDIVGQPVDRAEAILLAMGVALVVGGPAPAPDPLPDPLIDLHLTIGEQDPPPGTDLHAGDTVTVTIYAICVEVATILGTDGNDLVQGTPERDIIHGLDGDDTIVALGTGDVVCGGPGDDEVLGGDGNDMILGGPGNDVIDGEGRDDVLFGNSGDDDVRGGPGDDDVRGGAGNDRVDGGPDTDIVDGGGGTDECFNGEEYKECESTG